jgi:hypothetical protein
MRKLTLSLFFICGLAAFGLGQEPAASTIQKVPLGQAEIDKIIGKFTNNEKLSARL